MVFLITYDLNDEGKDYNGLFSAIKSLGQTHKDTKLDSVWFLSTSLTINAINDYLTGYIDKTDRLFITQLKTGEYSGWMHQTTWDWLSQNV